MFFAESANPMFTLLPFHFKVIVIKCACLLPSSRRREAEGGVERLNVGEGFGGGVAAEF
jgi:hypothetical protein